MRTGALFLIFLLAAPTAAAWSYSLAIAPDAVSVRDGLMLAGAVSGRAEGVSQFGAPMADRITFDTPGVVLVCPDRGGNPTPRANCAEIAPITEARLYIHAGGLVATTTEGAISQLQAPASAATLGGPNVTLNRIPLGPGVVVGGASTVTVNTTTLTLRPLGSTASIEVRGNEGFQTFTGTAYTMYISNISLATLESRGAVLASPTLNVTLARAPLAAAEAGIRIDPLFDTLRLLQPPERADRRADLTGAFGPFQTVPALLNGATAARANLTFNGEPRTEFTLLRVDDIRLIYEDDTWMGAGNATYMVDGAMLLPAPGARESYPAFIPVLFILGAIVARVLTQREPVARRRRVSAGAVRAVGFIVLALVAGARLSPLLGFSPIFDMGALTIRSRVQLTLLVAGMVGSAWLGLGLALESLTRSAFAWRGQGRAMALPALAGIVAAALFMLLATPVLLSFVARFVRL